MAFDLQDAASIALAPYLDRETLRDDVRQRAHMADAARHSGVCFGGMAPQPVAQRTEAEKRAAAEAARDHAIAFAESVRGRFVMALRELEVLGYYVEVNKARSAYCRGFSDPARPASVGEIAVAQLALSKVLEPRACVARDCLSELLLAVDARRAA